MIEEKCGITSMFISQDQRHLLLNLAQQRIHLHELGDPATNTPSPSAGVGPVQKYVGTLEQKGRFVVRSCLGGINQAFVLSGSEDNKVCQKAQLPTTHMLCPFCQLHVPHRLLYPKPVTEINSVLAAQQARAAMQLNHFKCAAWQHSACSLADSVYKSQLRRNCLGECQPTAGM